MEQVIQPTIMIEKPKWGRPAGSKNELTVYKEKALERFQVRLNNIVDRIFNTQAVAAIGYQQMYKIEKKKGKIKIQHLVTSPEEMDFLMQHGELGKDYNLVVASTGDWRAGEALLNRGYGKAKETIQHQGGIGVFHVISSLNSDDSGADDN